MRTVMLALLATATLAAQSEVALAPNGCQSTTCQSYYGYSGGNLAYRCVAKSIVTSGLRAQTSVSITSATNANPVVFTSTGHGFAVNIRPKITISGATGNWTSVNGSFTATVIDANTFSIAVDSTSFSTLTGTLAFKTTAPRTTAAEWSVLMYGYDSSGNLTNYSWLNGISAMSQKCSDAALTTTNIQ